jgi:signal recognition particle GTPase
MASRILGKGDVVSLVEKAAAEVSDAETLKMSQKLLEAKFNFDDFMTQSRLVAKMGSFANVAKMIPGLGGALDGNHIRAIEKRFKKNEAMINSMTKKERANPDLFVTDKTARSRNMRITKGSACTFEDGVNFISEFQKMRSICKSQWVRKLSPTDLKGKWCCPMHLLQRVKGLDDASPKRKKVVRLEEEKDLVPSSEGAQYSYLNTI